MSSLSKCLLIGGLTLAGCSPERDVVPQPGTVERFTNEIERRDAGDKRIAIEAADARAESRADSAKQRISQSGRRGRVEGEAPAPTTQ